MKTLDLSGAWTLRQADKREQIPAAVPGCVHIDLLAAERIPDPFYRDNEKVVQWVSDVDWIYSREFDVPRELLEHDEVLLRCEGLDTLATIAINGKPAGRADNMFRTWEFDAKPLLREGDNRIEVRFDSARRYTLAKQKDRYIHAWNDKEGVQYLRKEACNYGWDWGPKLITCGIWRGISLVGWSTSRVEEVLVKQEHASGRAMVEITAWCEKRGRGAGAKVQLRATLSDNSNEIASETASTRAGGSHTFRFTVKNPKLWFPAGLGEQPLYNVAVELLDADGEQLDSWARRIGLRTLRLERKKDKWGETFQFAVNGAPFFAKGANWIPSDPFAPRITDDWYRGLVTAARDANMNMLRVWGGGIYEADVFYDLCDELGICVWQDMMFACSCYPTFDRDWMINVRSEMEDQLRRLRHHPSIAFWCGNNELEQGIVGDKWTEHQMPWSEYEKLFDKLIPEVVERLDPQRDYWPGSPHTPGKNRRQFNDPTRGDAHLWSVWHGREPFEWYRTAFHRFCSEFGFQSFPEPKTTATFTEPEDLNISSYVMDFRQRSGIGNSAIMTYMLSWYEMPGNFEMLTWLSQIQQGMAMKYAVEHWRRQMPRSMGTLYWQINDTWSGPSWSSIDYFGRWKALHYMARRFFAPVMLSLVEKPKEQAVEVWIANDLRESVSGKLRVEVTDCAGAKLRGVRETVTIGKLKSELVATIDVSKQLKSNSARDVMVWAEFDAPGVETTRNMATFARPKHLMLREPKLKTKIAKAENGAWEVTVTAEHPAIGVWLELKDTDAKLSDNFFDLAGGASAVVRVQPQAKLTKQQLAEQLMVRSLEDTKAVSS